MADGLLGMSRDEIVDAVRALRDDATPGLGRLSKLVQALRGKETSPEPNEGGAAELAAPTDQARDDVVRHRKSLTDYAKRVDAMLRSLVPRSRHRSGSRVLAQSTVTMRANADRRSGRLAVANDAREEKTVTFRSEASGIRVLPETFELGPREARTVCVEADAGAQLRSVTVMMSGQPVAVAHLRDGSGSTDGAAPTGVPLVDLPEAEDELDDILRHAQLAIIKHPLAAQALFRAFVAEGRAYGETAEGAAWRERLARSELSRRGRVVWEVLSQKVLEEESTTMLPTKLLDAFVRAVESEGLEPTLTQQMGFVMDDEDPADTTPR